MTIEEQERELAKRFSKLSREFAPVDEIKKAFDEWQDFIDKNEIRKPARKTHYNSNVYSRDVWGDIF